MTFPSITTGPGERLQRHRQRRRIAIKGTLFGVGLVSAVLFGTVLASNAFDLAAPWPPGMAPGLAAAYLMAITSSTRA